MSYQPTLDWIDSQQNFMASLLEKWASINSWTYNLAGLSTMANEIIEAFSALKVPCQRKILAPFRQVNIQGEWEKISLGEGLFWQKNRPAAIQVFLGGHMDTVFSPSSSFQKVEKIAGNKMKGPGVADMKGGLIVLLIALLAFEQSPYAQAIGWEILINPDEEIGSPGSAPLFVECAQRNKLGLVFEPSFADGAFASSRKGSYNWTAVAKGRSAHVGRDFHQGRNALSGLTKFLLKAEAFILKEKGVIFNIGSIEGGGPVNIVPDRAIGKFNMRLEIGEDIANLSRHLVELAHQISSTEEIDLKVYQTVGTPPKPFDTKIQSLFRACQDCAEMLGMDVHWKPSGGTCDGSKLYAAGLPNIDTLGVIGGNLHTEEEFLFLDSLKERAKLVALFLMRLAAGDLNSLLEGI
jgi:glutamate carboxypeptidase